MLLRNISCKRKKKNFKSGTKNVLFVCIKFGPKRHFLSIFRLKLEQSNAIFGITTLEFPKFRNFERKQKCLNLRPKIPYLGIFLTGIWKPYCHIWNHHLRNCLIEKFCEKMKMSKFGIKTPLFGYFGARILKSYCEIWNEDPRICQIAKFCEKMKFPKFGTKIVYLGIFWLQF